MQNPSPKALEISHEGATNPRLGGTEKQAHLTYIGMLKLEQREGTAGANS